MSAVTPKFRRFTLIQHYKGGIYLVLTTPDNTVLEADRKRAYTYLIDKDTICVREAEEMEEPGRFVELPDEAMWTYPPEKVRFVREYIQAMREVYKEAFARYDRIQSVENAYVAMCREGNGMGKDSDVQTN